jgi:hypothetical protein
MAISYYAQRLPSDLPALGAHLVPGPSVHLTAAVAQLTCERDDLANDELSDRARVREGRVEDADSMRRGVLEIDLVRADAEASDDNQVLGFGEDAGSKLSFGTDTEDVDITKEGSLVGESFEFLRSGASYTVSSQLTDLQVTRTLVILLGILAVTVYLFRSG